jgi:hypothetical protein
VISGSTISSSVGSVDTYGYKARIAISPASVCAVSVIAGTEVFLEKYPCQCRSETPV